MAAMGETAVAMAGIDKQGADGAPGMKAPELSIVVPVLNEEQALPLFVERLSPMLSALTPAWEIVVVDDGSQDGTMDALRAACAQDPRIRGVKLSRNFGKEAALTAGLAASRGAAVVPMDVDLQDPPELLAEFWRLWKMGAADTIVGQRTVRESDSWMKRRTAGMFYRVFNAVSAHKISENAGDFRLMDRKVVDATLLLREKNRFMKGLFAWVGFRTVAVPYTRPSRSVGVSKFNYWKLWNFALDGITGYSTVPLRVWTYAGSVVAALAFLWAVVVGVKALVFGVDTPGYPSLMIAVLFLGGIQLVSMGVLGEYLGRLYMESKNRPLYIVESEVGDASERG